MKMSLSNWPIFWKRATDRSGPKANPIAWPASIFKRVPVDSSARIDQGFPIVNLEVETGCLIVSGYAVSAAGKPITGEFVFPSTGKRTVLSVLMPRGTAYIYIKNVTNNPCPRRCKIVRVSYSSFDDISGITSPAIGQLIDQAERRVFIHTIGKTGSTSLHNTLFELPKLICMWDHFVNLPGMSADPQRPEASMLLSLTLQKLISSRIAMHFLSSGFSRPDTFDVICGIRRFETQLLASMFQGKGMSYCEQGLSAEEILDSVYNADPAAYTWQYWWETEFFATHKFTSMN
jgi:hypothetical protein